MANIDYFNMTKAFIFPSENTYIKDSLRNVQLLLIKTLTELNCVLWSHFHGGSLATKHLFSVISDSVDIILLIL